MCAARPPQQYEAIADYLRTAIRDGVMAAGNVVPSEAQLCEQFSSSRGPVRQAMATLRAEGLISSGRGRRSIVLEAPETESFEEILSVTAWMKAAGINPTAKTQLVGRRPAPADVAAKLEIKEGDPIVTVHRLRLADGTPMLIERIDLRMEAGRHILGIDTDTDSVHRTLLLNGIDLNNVSRTLTAVPAPEEDARLLEMEPGAPLIDLEIRCFTHAGTPIELAEYRYRADLISLGMNSTRGNPSPLWVRTRL